jgi:hypothetical protein
MAVIVGIVIACALFVTLAGGVFTDFKIFGLLREQRRTLPAEAQRQTLVLMATVFPVVIGYLAFLFVLAPLGRRATVIWFLIVPFMVLMPLGMIAAAMRSYRLGRHRTSGDVYGHDEGPKAERTPYKYGGSLGWVASMIDPETSSWKATNRPKPKPQQADPDESETSDDSSS